MKRTTFLAVIVCGSVIAADPKPRGWKPSFERLQRCAASLPAEFQKPVATALADLNTGLNGGFLREATAKPPVPPAYVDSLNGDAELCEYARARASSIDVSGLVNQLVRDIEIKTEDCRQNGWYRIVRVDVATLRDGQPSPGWEIFYEWLPGRNLPSLKQVRFKALSPASEMLPPGLYAFQARKKDVVSSSARVAVVSKGTITCEIPVP